jgi:PAS domain S-box-containing protein
MSRIFALRGLKYRILAVTLSGIMVSGALWLGVIVYFKAEQSRANELRATVKNARIAALRMGNEANEYMSWDVRTPTFQKTGRTKNLDEYEAAQQKLDQEIEHLASLEYASLLNPGAVEELAGLSKKYQQTFRRLVTAFRERGYDIWGLEGKLEQSILKLEAVLAQFQDPNLQNDLLELRRAQQDYLHLGQEQHVLQFRYAITPLRNRVMTFADGGDLLERVNGCEAAFDELLAVQKKIGLKEGEGLRGELTTTDLAMDPLIEELLREAIARDDRAERTFDLMLLAGGLVSLLLGAAFAIAFARRLSRPIEALTRVMGEVVESGDLTRRVEVQSADEVGLLSAAFNRMVEKLNRSQESLTSVHQGLEQAKEEFKLLLDSTAEGIYGIDLEGNCIFCNPACVHLLGYEKLEDLLGQHMHNLLHHTRPDGSPYPVGECRIYQAFREGKGTHVDDEVFWRADGSSFPAEYWSSPMYREREIIGTVVTFMEISERKRGQEALQESESRWRAVTQSAMDAIVIADNSGRIVTWNRGAETTFGYTANEVIGKPLDLLMPERYREAHQKGMTRVNTTGESRFMGKLLELHGLRKDGREFPLELLLTTWKVGADTFYSGNLRDITERKRVEVELRGAKEAAEAASRSKSEFLANMSHEIRTPMNGVIGMSELLLDTPLDAEQREYAETIGNSADLLLTIINDILDFSKIEAKHLTLEALDFNLRDAMSNALQPLGPRAAKKGLELACDVLANVPDNVVGDPSRLRQVVNNLVGNSIKFTDSGEVVLRVELASQTPDEIELHFSIRDTGIGIPADKHELIFEPFGQADGSTTRKYGGTGLGLTIATKLVEMMGGRIWVESCPGQGSTFHFLARFAHQKGTTVKVPPASIARLLQCKVLIVDDNASNRRILEDMVRQWEMRPATIADGVSALIELERATDSGDPFSLILVDGNMPEMDGFALAERIKTMPACGGATIMMLTSGGQRGDAARCRELGVAAYLVKPIRQGDLLNAILEALGTVPIKKAPLISLHTLPTSQRRLRILLAEDNSVNQRLAVRLLEKRGHSVAVANNGREALAALEKEPFQLILMDVQMPEMDGMEVTARIRALEKGTGKHIPILAMTAHAMQGDRERCLAGGMDGYFSKPIRILALHEMIEQVVPLHATPDRVTVPAQAVTGDPILEVFAANRS